MFRLKTDLPSPSLSPDDAAVEWFVKIRSAKLSQDEQLAFDRWRAIPENDAAFVQTETLWLCADEIATQPEIMHERHAALYQEEFRIPRRAVAAIAASILVVVAAGIGLSYRTPAVQKPGEFVASLFESPRRAGVFSTSVGERSIVTLSDNSVLTLDTDSLVRVAYSGSERKITLGRGQVLFAVAKNDPRPFVVHAGDQQIVATGTAFNVRVDNGRIETTLVEGRVVVDQVLAPDVDRKAVPARKTQLQPGERLVTRVGGPLLVSVANVESVTSWTAGKLTFRDRRLVEAVAEVNRYTDSPIVLESDPGLEDLRVNGVFRTGQPADFASAIAEIYPVTTDRDASGQLRIVWARQN